MARLIKLTFLGDAMCQMQQIAAVGKARMSWQNVMSGVKHLWADSDYVVANLETPATGNGFRLAFEEMRFNAPIGFLSALKNAGIDFVTTANNHILDRGPEGLNATLHQLDSEGLEHTGAYRTKQDAEQIFVKEIKGVRFAFVACTYDTNAGRKSDILNESDFWKIDYVHHPTAFLGSFTFAIKRTLKGLIPYALRQRIKNSRHNGVSSWSRPQLDSFPVSDFLQKENLFFLHRICEKIRNAHKMADIVIALPHIGGQYNIEPGPWQLKVTDALIEAGADLVIANHAHTPLRAEVRRGVFCVHALGNFCFTPRVGYYNDQCQADYSLVLTCIFDADIPKLIGWQYSICKNITSGNGVSIVVPAQDSDSDDVAVIKRRVGYPLNNYIRFD